MNHSPERIDIHPKKTILLQNGKIISSQGNILKKDLLIKNGKISQINDFIDCDADTTIDLHEKLVCPGFIDMHVHLRDPGQTNKEDIDTGTMAAVAGGFTQIACMPNTTPTADNNQVIDYIKKKADSLKRSKVMPIAAITKGLAGKELTNFKELKKIGVIGLSDDGKGLQDEAIMSMAMKKAYSCNLPILAHCEDESFLPGDTRQAEISHIKRDIELARKTKCHYHVCHISCKESVELIRNAKKKMSNISCEVAPHHVLLSQDDSPPDDTAFKMNPPLRNRDDIDAIISGIKDGTIDIIATDHAPHTEDEKSQSYNLAPNGIIGMETAFPSLYSKLVLSKKISLQKLIEMMSINPSKIFSINNNNIIEGNTANLTIIDLEMEKVVNKKSFYSKAQNTPLHNKTLKGWPVITIVSGEIVWKM